jgi:hypothetical protein
MSAPVRSLAARNDISIADPSIHDRGPARISVEIRP